MGPKTLSVWTVLAALAGGSVLAQDDSGWAKSRGPGALPPADPDDAAEIAAPLVPPMPPIPPVPAIPGRPGDAPAPRVVVVPCDTPVAEVLSPRWEGLSAGVGFAVLRPYVSNNPAFTVANPPVPGTVGGSPLLGAASQTVSFDWDPKAAVQFWVAYDDPSGFGGRVRAFAFDAESPAIGMRLVPGGAVPITLPVLVPSVGGVPGFAAPSPVLTAARLGEDRLTFQSDLRICSTDVEGTFGWMGDDSSLQVSAGVRYLLLRQGYTARLANAGDGTTSVFEELRVSREFEGCGPTAGLFARHRICQSPCAVYVGARCSVLVGTMDTETGFARAINDPTQAAGLGTQRARTSFGSRSDVTIPVTELELGVEYGELVGRYGVFVRAGVVAQTYFDAGGAASPLGNLTLIGGQVAVGVAY
ncbi:MAG TPA: Lpg1974 family pore-forming outer membrane protein [Gemmataceae bacterium]|nr:Lpg1974 family pore-forming outer membrane protein [Gemmataceae bacterium]